MQKSTVEAFSSLAQWPVSDVSAVLIAGDQKLYHGNERTIFELASVTKLLVTATALIAVGEGAIDLSDSSGPPDATVRHLLSHASGLSASGDAIECQPGTQRIYSSQAFEILAQHIEQATEIPFAHYVNQAICEPLGLTNTQLYGSAGYGAVSTVADLAVFVQEILEPQYIPADLLQESFTVQYPNINGFVPGYGKHKPNDWGLGFEIHGTKKPHWLGTNQPEYLIGHFGQAGTFLWCDYRLKIAAIVLTNRSFGQWAKPLWSDFNANIYQSLIE